MPALALTDHDGLYGAMEFAQAARAFNVRPITGAELTLSDGYHLTLLAVDRQGYTNLCQLITAARMTDREHPHLDPALLPVHTEGLVALSGCRRGEAAARVTVGDLAGAERALRRYRDLFTPERFFVELQRNYVYGDSARVAALAGLALQLGLRPVATNNIHYHLRTRHRLHDVLVAIRSHTTLDGCHDQRRPNAEFFLKGAAEMALLFRDIPEAVHNTVPIAEHCTFDLTADLAYRFPDYYPPTGETPDAYLARLCHEEFARRYRSRTSDDVRVRAAARLNEELRLIAKHGLAGFFLQYRDLLLLARDVADEVYARDAAQRYPPESRPQPGRGRGSSVSSLVCYLIGLSHIDPITTKLFLGRFLNDELASVPDIDLDFPREVRAELLARIFASRPDHTALVCTIISYRRRSAVRDIGKALALPADTVATLAKRAEGLDGADLVAEALRCARPGSEADAARWRLLAELVDELVGLPRHISQHVGGVVLAAHPLVELAPLEPAAMPGRRLLAWDKDSIDDARAVKIDFLSLGMLSAVDECLALIHEQHGIVVDLGRIDHDDQQVYDMISRADTIGVFQVESRAQQQILPRLQPCNLADLTVAVAIIRPGPINGGAVHPYLERHQRPELTEYDHDLLRPVLEETLGVILFQEQVLQVATALAGFTSGQAEQLRRAMSRKRSQAAMEGFGEMFRDGARTKGVSEEIAARVFDKLRGFSGFGFPKAHSAAFGLLAYESAWLKRRYPVEFYTALLNAQPMGFYSPEVLIGDAKRHGIEVLPVDVNASRARCTVEHGALRLGFRYVTGLGDMALKQLEAARRDGPYASLREFCRRAGLAHKAVESLIAVGACRSFGLHRRELLWQLGLVYRAEVHGAAGTARGERAVQEALPLPVTQDMATLRPMTAREETAADYATTGLSPHAHWMQFVRPHLDEGVASSKHLHQLHHGLSVRIAGMVVCRQRPMTARGFLFLTLEDEFGLVNIIVRPAVYEQFRRLWRDEPLVIVRGVLQRRDGVTNVIAVHVTPLSVHERIALPESKDFR